MTELNNFIILNISYPTKKINIHDIVDLIYDKLKELKKKIEIKEDELFLTIDEAVTNAIDHGNKWDSSKKISIKAYLDLKFLHIKIIDEGNGFKISNLAHYLENRDRYDISGRGILLIKKFCKPFWNKKGNQIDLQVKLK